VRAYNRGVGPVRPGYLARGQARIAMSDPAAAPQRCPACGTSQEGSLSFARYRVCDRCGEHFPLGARQRLAQLVDPGSFSELAEALISSDPLEFTDRMPYRERLAQARERTGL